jgi:phosphatidylglycerol lysyltransferase
MITAEKPLLEAEALLLDSPVPLRKAAALAARLRPLLSVTALAWAVRGVAVFNMVNALLRYQPKFIFWLGKSVPMEITESTRIRMFLMSVLLFILASGLQRGKKLAWQITLLGLMLAPILHLDRGVIWPQAAMNLLLVVFLVWHRHYFTAESDPRSIRSALIACPLLAVGLLTFGTVRLHALHKGTVGDHTWTACVQTASQLVFLHHAKTQLAVSPHAKDLFATLRLGGTAVSLVGLFLILRPVIARRRSRTEHRERARWLVDEYGSDPLDPYALLDDKQYFFTESGYAMVPYVLSGNLAVALADPVGAPGERAGAIAEFALFCRLRDWQPVFYEVSGEFMAEYEQAGFCVFKAGEEARLDAANFSLKGREYQNLRTACNGARKNGMTFRWYDASFGIDAALEAQLEKVSTAWIEGKKTHEMAFDMGSFSIEAIRYQGVGVAIDAEGRAQAFATWRQFAHGTGRCLDLMRAYPGCRNVMDFVLVESILHFREVGLRDISLGSAPLANADEAARVGEETAVRFLYENMKGVYRYKSLFEFKRKYRPQWHGRYIAYHRGLHLPLVGLAVARVHTPGGVLKFLRA